MSTSDQILGVVPPRGGAALVLAKRNALVLATAQAVVGAVAPVSIAMGGLAGAYLLLEDKSLATAPVAGYNVGVAVGALPAAMLMRAVGRRLGLMSGALLASAGGLLAAFALFEASFWLFVAGLGVVGFAGAFSQQYRFAATDHAPPEFRSRAISWVLAGGLFAAVIGPQMAIATGEMFAPVMFAGSFVGVALLGLVGVAILSALRVPAGPAASGTEANEAPARPLAEIVRQPAYVTALVCSVGAYALMSFVMTGAPLAMVACGHSEATAYWGIQWHVMAMFGPSFFTGTLIARFGRSAVMATGFGLLVACAVVAMLGLSVANFWIALVLLGVGWNFGFIGATSMVTETYRPSEKNKAQGFHDLVLFSCVATASLLSGGTLNALGWGALNAVVIPVSLACVLVLAWNRRASAGGERAAAQDGR